MPRQLNPVLYAVITIPLATVVAGFGTLYLAFDGNGHELPMQYAWEGAALEADLARSQAARDLKVGVRLSFTAAQQIEARLTGTEAMYRPAHLQLRLTHGTRPELDRVITLELQDPEHGRYVGRADQLPSGSWWVEVAHDPYWRLRGRLLAFDTPLELGVLE